MITSNKVLITGTNGMLGKEVSKFFPKAAKIPGRKHLDLSNLKKVSEFLDIGKYETIIHLAAITNLKECKDDTTSCTAIHSEVVDAFNEKCNKLIYISTVPVWDKRDISKYSDPYFYTKREGEKRTLEKDRNLVIRTNIVGDAGLSAWAIEATTSGEKIFGYTNSFFNPVHTKELSKYIYDSYLNRFSGIHSAFGDTIITKYDFIKQLLIKKGLDLSLLEKKALQESEDLVYYKKGKNNKIFNFKQCLEML